MALEFLNTNDDLPLEDTKIVCRYKHELSDSQEYYGEFKMEKCYSNDSPTHFVYNFYLVEPLNFAGVPFKNITGWSPFVEDWQEQLEGSGDD